MKRKIKNDEPASFRLRKFIHYSLLLCILLIQLLIAGFFYNEFVSRQNSKFIQNQLDQINTVEKITDNSRKQLLQSQDFFQKYLITNDKKFLEAYFESVNRLTKNFESINRFKNPNLTKILIRKTADTSEFRKLKQLADSTYQFSTKSGFKIREDIPQLKKADFDYNFDKFDIQTQTYSDTVKKKGLFGRLGDAIAGKENVRKESTVITVKNGGATNDVTKIKSEMDSLMKSVNNHYTHEVKKIQLNITKNRDGSSRFYKIFNNLLIYSNDLMMIYEHAVKDAKAELENELEKQNSASNNIRHNLILGAMILMFIVSVLIMYLTRIAFVYEKKLSSANLQIRENLNFKNRILGMLSHELRSPLKIIGIFINRINKRTEDETVKQYLKSISFTNDSLLIQANQILEYTKNQNKANKIVPTAFNLRNEITAILASVKPFIETRNNQFLTDININPKLEIFSDRTKIHQIFMNILGNANKFTENGEISVISKSEVVDEKTITLTTEIRDTGAGISKSDLENIFDPYYQGVLSEDVENLGAGLGLSLCKEIVELFGGEITVESDLGKGTTVRFSLKLSINL